MQNCRTSYCKSFLYMHGISYHMHCHALEACRSYRAHVEAFKQSVQETVLCRIAGQVTVKVSCTCIGLVIICTVMH